MAELINFNVRFFTEETHRKLVRSFLFVHQFRPFCAAINTRLRSDAGEHRPPR